MKKRTKYLITAFLFLLLTVFYIFAIRTVDVQPIGPQGTSVGFASLNKSVSGLTGTNMQLYKLTEILGYISIATAGIFALLGLAQLIRRKSPKAVDPAFYCLAVLYAVTVLLYAGFEHFVVNYRPVIMPDSTVPEASFPSTHTLLVCVVMGSAIFMISRYLKSSVLKTFLKTVCILVLAATVIGRLLSGVHWLTDIIGGLLISLTLVTAFCGAASDT